MGCGTTAPSRIPPAPPQQKAVNVEILLPTLALHGRKSAETMKGPLMISVSPSFGPAIRRLDVAHSVPKDDMGVESYWTVTTPFFTPPERMQFDVMVKNTMDKPLKLSDASVSVSVGETALPARDLAEANAQLHKIVVPRESEMTFRLTGPPFSALGGPGVFTMAIREVPIKFYPDGEVLRTAYFTWDFEFGTQTEIRRDTVVSQCYEKSASLNCPGGPRGGFCGCGRPEEWKTRGQTAPLAKVYVVEDPDGKPDRLIGEEEKVKVGEHIVLEVKPRSDFGHRLYPRWALSPGMRGRVTFSSSKGGRIMVSGSRKGETALTVTERGLEGWTQTIPIRVK